MKVFLWSAPGAAGSREGEREAARSWKQPVRGDPVRRFLPGGSRVATARTQDWGEGMSACVTAWTWAWGQITSTRPPDLVPFPRHPSPHWQAWLRKQRSSVGTSVGWHPAGAWWGKFYSAWTYRWRPGSHFWVENVCLSYKVTWTAQIFGLTKMVFLFPHIICLIW